MPSESSTSGHQRKVCDQLPTPSLLPTFLSSMEASGAIRPTSTLGEMYSSFVNGSSRGPASRGPVAGRPSGVTCPFCTKWCPCKAEMDRHVRTHTGERPFKCHLCSYSATVKCTLQNHLRAKHDIHEKIWLHMSLDWHTIVLKILDERWNWILTSKRKQKPLLFVIFRSW